MKILYISTEVVPFIKTGGLGDVSGALPKALRERGHDIRIVLPKYSKIKDKNFDINKTSIHFTVPKLDFEAEIEKVIYPSSDIMVYFIKCDHYFNRDEVYGNYKDNAERFIFFSRAALEFLKYLNWKPVVIHCNDWPTGLLPALLKTRYHQDSNYNQIHTLFTIHNIAYQGIFPKEAFEKTDLEGVLFDQQKIELWGKLNFLKAGLLCADLLNTVSERYALEIQTPEFGYGLEKILKKRHEDLFGILNGIDYEIWNPQTDSHIWHTYDMNSLERKELNKIALQKESNLPQLKVPLIGVVSRLVDQKGFDLVADILDDLMRLDLQFVLLGTGQAKYHELFTHLREKYPSKSAIYIKFDNILAHQIEAGADFFLMPSRYEPCGLNQLISLRYGTIPIVRSTGGLADSIVDLSDNPRDGVGFVFKEYESQELLQTIHKAINFYQNESQRLAIMKRGMLRDFSWQISAQKYEILYQKALQKD